MRLDRLVTPTRGAPLAKKSLRYRKLREMRSCYNSGITQLCPRLGERREAAQIRVGRLNTPDSAYYSAYYSAYDRIFLLVRESRRAKSLECERVNALGCNEGEKVMRLLTLVTALCGLMVAGCSLRYEISSSPVTVQRPISDPAEVRIVGDLPAGSYTQVARIQLRWTGFRSEWQIRRDERIRQMLQTEAARLGADAVIDLNFVTVDRWNRGNEPWPRRIVGVSATAVRTRSRA